jgi:hypothetical protein
VKFYEFKVNNGFGYYALIGAETGEKAIEFYKETVADIEDEEGIVLSELTRYRAKEKFMSTIENWNDKMTAHKEFEENINKNEPYLILIDGSLL